MTVEQIKKRIREAEAACANEALDMGSEEGYVLVMDVYPKRNIKKALKELGIEKYCISCDSVAYTIYM